MSLESLDSPEQEPPPLIPRLYHAFPLFARARPCPPSPATIRTCLYAVGHRHTNVGRTQRLSKGDSPSQESGGREDRAIAAQRVIRLRQNSSTTVDMQTAGCSTISASPIRLRKAGAKSLEEARNDGHDTGKRLTFRLGAVFHWASPLSCLSRYEYAMSQVLLSTVVLILAVTSILCLVMGSKLIRTLPKIPNSLEQHHVDPSSISYVSLCVVASYRHVSLLLAAHIPAMSPSATPHPAQPPAFMQVSSYPSYAPTIAI